MLAHNVSFLVTENGDDSAPFDEIDIRAFEDVLSRTSKIREPRAEPCVGEDYSM